MIKIILFILMITAAVNAQDNTADKQKFTEMARSLFDKAVNLVENAKGTDDFQKAINDFKESLKLAAFGGIYTELNQQVYYNLGLLYEKLADYDKASFNLLMYVSTTPAPDDATEVRQKIRELDKKAEQFINPETLAGLWYYSVPKEMSEPRIEIRHNKNTGTMEIRCLPCEATGNTIPAGAFVKFNWDYAEKKLTVKDAPYYDCEKSLDPNWCPHKITLTLIRTGENKLEGELISTGIIYQDINKPEIFTSSGKVVYERLR